MTFHQQKMTPSQILFSERAKAARARMAAAALRPAQYEVTTEMTPIEVAAQPFQWQVKASVAMSIGDDVIESAGPYKWRAIAFAIAAKHGLALSEILTRCRSQKIMAARQEIFWALRHQTPMSLPDIARRMGGFDHTTVLHGIRKHEQRMRGAANG